MFQSAIGNEAQDRRSFRNSALASLFFHAALAAFFFFRIQPIAALAPPAWGPEVTFRSLARAPSPALGNLNPSEPALPRPPPRKKIHLRQKEQVAWSEPTQAPEARTVGVQQGAPQSDGENTFNPDSDDFNAGQRGDSDSEGVKTLVAGMSRPRCNWVFDYTSEARKAGVEGTVKLRCNVLSNGTVSACEVSDDLPLMKEPILAIAQAASCKPASLNGQAIDVNFEQSIRFVLTP
jgi:periplasmic protein TonB